MSSVIHNHSSHDMYELKNQSVALIVTSPPYPMIKKWDDLFGNVNFELQHEYLFQTWKECYRVLIEGGIMCINIGDATRKIANENNRIGIGYSIE